ncbi:MAG TPA: NAD(P)-dependent oxidoreductase [Desulfomonilaceae bacterium]|nr:NAD(P)-dependent oxidoreductase [Desulfomonilaceae bacterium]
MKVAFIGLGTMGGPMALNIMKAGHDLIIYNRTAGKEELLTAQGAQRAASPTDAARKAEVIVTCLSDTPDVEDVVLGADGIIHGAQPGTIVVDMSTISPEATRRIAQAVGQKGIRMVDAPVSGGSEGAQRGTLAIMVGGNPEDVEKVLPVLQSMGTSVTHVGPIGAGQLTKAINQIIIAGVYFSVAEGMVLGIKAGLDMEKVLQAVSHGAAGSWVLTNRSRNMIDNSYPLGFRVRLHQKDLRIALETARKLGVTLPVAALVDQIENGIIARGYGDEDVSAMARSIREQSGID